jgi:hypothetical protein
VQRAPDGGGEPKVTVVMATSKPKYSSPVFTRPILIIVGGYGSGKSEVSVNLARTLVARQTDPVAIADLDIVNPYFRSREAEKALEHMGVHTINPKGGHYYADLPIILPEIKGSVQRHDGTVILDVGGDDVGARILSSLGKSFEPGTFELLLVHNANRPFTADVDGTLDVMAKIEAACKLGFTGIVSNTHLLEQTDSKTVLDGLEKAKEVAGRRGLPVVFLSATKDVLKKIDARRLTVPVLELERNLLKPWERPKLGKDQFKI